MRSLHVKSAPTCVVGNNHYGFHGFVFFSPPRGILFTKRRNLCGCKRKYPVSVFCMAGEEEGSSVTNLVFMQFSAWRVGGKFMKWILAHIEGGSLVRKWTWTCTINYNFRSPFGCMKACDNQFFPENGPAKGKTERPHDTFHSDWPGSPFVRSAWSSKINFLTFKWNESSISSRRIVVWNSRNFPRQLPCWDSRHDNWGSV